MSEETLCSDCPPVDYPVDYTRCIPCPRRKEPYVWTCGLCLDQGWVNEKIGGTPISNWIECPDCNNPHGGSHP